MTPRMPVLAAIGALVLGIIAAAPAAAAPPAVPAAAPSGADGTTTLNGFRNVGYYGGWQAAGPAHATLKKLFVDRPNARDITHLDYAFGNISGSQEALDAARKAGAHGLDGVKPGQCFISDSPAPAAGETDAAGDAQNDFVRAYTSKDSVLGLSDTKTQPLAGNFNQLRQLKRLYPDLKVNVSLGGWSWSKSFSTAVATPQSRAALATSCIDLYIKGNLPRIDGRGGPGAAAGIFTGFDLDWEWPGAPDWAQEVGNKASAADAANFLAFVKELREQLDDLSAQTGDDYELSAFLPASPTVIDAGGWNAPELFRYLDYGNLQGYDLTGSWATETGYQDNIHGDAAQNYGLGLDSIVNSYTDAGVDPAQLNIGVPAYGQGWKDAQPAAWTAATGLGTRSYDDLKAEGTALKVHHDYVAGDGGAFTATWAYDAKKKEFWSYADPFSVAEKTSWAVSQGLGGMDFWELSQDVDGDLPAASAAVLQKSEYGPVSGHPATLCQTTPGATSTAWNAQTVYQKGDRAYIDGTVYEAAWYTRGEVPGDVTNGPWTTLTACGVSPAVVQEWAADKVYTTGDKVLFHGVTYTAQWWTRGEKPGVKWGPWKN